MDGDPAPRPEGAADIGLSAYGRQLCLRRRRAQAHQRFERGDAEMPREFPGLVEAPATLARAMERDRHDGVGILKKAAAG